MSGFISVQDLAESSDYGEQRAIKDEIAALAFDLKRMMDAGLSPDDMRTASLAKDGVYAAATILNKIFS